MSSDTDFSAAKLADFSLPHCFVLLGENQYLIGRGSITVAAGPRVRVRVEDTEEEFQIALAAGGAEGGQPPNLTQSWRKALSEAAGRDLTWLDGLRLSVDFGLLWEICPAPVLLTSPAFAAAATCAAAAHGDGPLELNAEELAELAAQALAIAAPSPQTVVYDRAAETLTCLRGGGSHVEPGSGSINAQRLMPPHSLLLAIRPGKRQRGRRARQDEQALEAMKKLGPAAGKMFGSPDEAISVLFNHQAGTLTERETALLYGVLRVRQMISSLLESLAEPSVDHDLLGEMCDEESEILRDYFEFPPACDRIRQRARQAGAVGTKLTYAFGSWPALLILAPGRREEIADALAGQFSDVRFLPLEVESAGVLSDSEEPPCEQEGPY